MLNDDPELEIVRLALQKGTNKSVKQTVLTCLLIRAAQGRRGRVALPLGVAGSAGSLALAYWHHPIWLLLSHLFHLVECPRWECRTSANFASLDTLAPPVPYFWLHALGALGAQPNALAPAQRAG